MPKYVEYDSDEEEEIEVIPFVKPAPPVIDLVDDDDNDNEEESSKKVQGKKSKKKKKKRDGGAVDSDEFNSTTATNNVSLSDNDNVTQIQAVNVETEKSLQSKKGGRNVEPSSTNVRNEISNKNSGSENVASRIRGIQSTTTITTCSEIDNPLNSQLIAVTDSRIESRNMNLNIEVGNGGNFVSTLQVETLNGTAATISKSRKRSTEPRRPRKITELSATKKTAAEISSFLNTLGIPIEVRDLTPATPRRPRAARGKRTVDVSKVILKEGTMTTEMSISSKPVTTGAGLIDESCANFELGGFVQVTHEISAPRKKNATTKKRNKPSEIDLDVINDVARNRLPRSADLITNFVDNGSTWQPEMESECLYIDETYVADKSDEPTPKRRKKKDRNSIDTVNLDDAEKVNESSIISPMDVEGESPYFSQQTEEISQDTPSKKKKKRNRNKDNDEEIRVENLESKSNNSDSSDSAPRFKQITSKNKEKNPCKSPTKKKSRMTVFELQNNETVPTSEETAAEGLISKLGEESSIEKTKTKNRNRTPSDSQTSDNGKKEKEKNADVDKQNMPPPPPPDSLDGNKRKARRPEYFVNHPGFPVGWTHEMKTFYGTFRDIHYSEKDTFQRQSNDRSKWRIPLDMRKIRSGVRCAACNQVGHFARNCPDKYKPISCSMCGEKGHSLDTRGSNRCPKSCCLNCGRPSDKYCWGCRDCTYKRPTLKCSTCGVYDHNSDSCPDNWRRYHSITKPLPDGAEQMLTSVSTTQYEKKHNLFCCNCASVGHNYYDCNAARYKNNPYHRNKPYIVKELDLSAIQNSLMRPDVDSQDGQRIPSPNRTVVHVNAQTTNVENESEMMSIQIQNDQVNNDNERSTPQEKPRRLDTDPSTIETELCSRYPDCSNIITKLENCHQIAVNSYQQSLLLKAQGAGAIRPIEEKYCTNISILRQALHVHISGDNWKAAENELYEILFTSAQEEQMARSKLPYSSSRPQPSSVSGETTRKVMEDGDNISVVISKPIFLDQTILPTAAPLPLVPSMDIDERFASPQDLIKNIPIIRPDGPFAPGQYVPQSVPLRFQLSSTSEQSKNFNLSHPHAQIAGEGMIYFDISKVPSITSEKPPPTKTPPPRLNTKTPPPRLNTKTLPPNLGTRTPTLNTKTPPSTLSTKTPPPSLGTKPPTLNTKTPPPSLGTKTPPPTLNTKNPTLNTKTQTLNTKTQTLNTKTQTLNTKTPNLNTKTQTLNTKTPPPSLGTKTPPPTLNTKTPPPILGTKTPPPTLNTKTPPPILGTKTPPPTLNTKTPPSMTNPAKTSTSNNIQSPVNESNRENMITLDDSDDEIIILEEIKEPPWPLKKVLEKGTPTPKKVQEGAKKSPRKSLEGNKKNSAFNVQGATAGGKDAKYDDGMPVVLLPSEWDVAFEDSMKKESVLSKIARLFGVTIFVSKENNKCVIRNGSTLDQQLAKEKVTLWFGCLAAKKEFVLNMPDGDCEQLSVLISPAKDKPKTIPGIPSSVENHSSVPDSIPLDHPREKGTPQKRNGSPKKGVPGSNQSRGRFNSFRRGSPVRRYNPAPNHSNPGSRNPAPRKFNERGSSSQNNRPPPRFPTRGHRGRSSPGNRNNNNKPEGDYSKQRFRYFT